MRIKYIILLLSGALLSSCVQHKQLINFPADQTVFSSPETLQNAIELKAQPNDLLRITVYSFNPEAAAPFNIDNLTESSSQQTNQQAALATGNYPIELFNGYLVDQEGYINFPVLGRLKVIGLTMPQIEQLVLTGTQTYLKDAVVTARFLNFKITVLGEVTKPGIVRVSNQRINLLEAIGNAGDFTAYANRTNVLLMREENGERFYQRLNFQSSDLFKSPYFYLRQNDVLYVEPIKAKVATVADPLQRTISYGAGLISVITLILTIFK